MRATELGSGAPTGVSVYVPSVFAKPDGIPDETTSADPTSKFAMVPPQGPVLPGKAQPDQVPVMGMFALVLPLKSNDNPSQSTKNVV
jgi:hypothetical protein